MGFTRIGMLATAGLGMLLAGCQTASLGSRSPAVSAADTAALTAAEPVRPAADQGAGSTAEGAIIDERAADRRDLDDGFHRVTRERYQEAMRRIDPQLANAAHQLVIARGLMKTCKEEEVMAESGMTRYFANTERIFGILFRHAFQMEVGRLNARGLPPEDAVLGLVLTREASMDATGKLIQVARRVESQATRQGRELTDAERLTISCALLAQGSERRTITRRISTPLLEYFVMMRHAHPSLFDTLGEGEELIENIRLLTRV